MGADIAQRASETGLEIMAAGGLAIASFQDLAVRIPHDMALSLLENAVRVSGDPGFALRAGRCVERGDFGVFHFLTASAATLGDSMHLAARYMPLLHDVATITIVEENDTVTWEHRLGAGFDFTGAANEYVVASFFFGSQQMLGFVGAPLEVRFRHRGPAHRHLYDAAFRAPVRFGAECNAIVMPRVALEAPLVTADPRLLGILNRYAEDLLKRLPSVHPIVRRVREWVRREIAHGAPLDALAKALHMSPSSVQRRLAIAGTTHTEILDDVRRNLAIGLLGETDLNISEIAFQLGFAHRPAFHRAFQRWYGCSPTTHRARQTGSPFYQFHHRGGRLRNDG
jgi:AraC-like DNA-binding protein